MTEATPKAPDELEPCRICDAPCRPEVFGPNRSVQETVTLYVCSQHEKFGGDCPSDTAYLTVGAWNDSALEASVEDSWQPIETAPKGQDCLFGHPDGSFVVGRLNQNGHVDDGDFHDNIDWLTHWRPLPAPPAIREKHSG